MCPMIDMVRQMRSLCVGGTCSEQLIDMVRQVCSLCWRNVLRAAAENCNVEIKKKSSSFIGRLALSCCSTYWLDQGWWHFPGKAWPCGGRFLYASSSSGPMLYFLPPLPFQRQLRLLLLVAVLLAAVQVQYISCQTALQQQCQCWRRPAETAPKPLQRSPISGLLSLRTKETCGIKFNIYDDALIEEKVKIVRGECPRGLAFRWLKLNS